MRPIDRDRLVRDELLPFAGAQRSRENDAPTIVVATQCIEAGADLDFDGLVTECASLDALRQRFGRVDRRGDLGSTRSVVLGRSDQIHASANDPVYGGALAATWTWLGSNATDGVVDFGIRALPPAVDADGAPLAALLAPVSDAPVMLPAHLDAWAQTSIRPTPDPDVAHWLQGPDKPAADVQIVWRALGSASVSDDDGSALRALDQIAAVRPSSLEAVTIPLGAARRWLAGEPDSAMADVIAGDAEGSEDAEPWRRRQRTSTTPPRVLRWSGDESAWIEPSAIRPGDVLVVDVAKGGLSSSSFDPDSAVGAVDLGDLAQLRARGVATLRLVPEALRVWKLAPDVAAALPVPTDEESLAELVDRVRTWFQTFPGAPPEGFVGTDGEWRAAVASWRSPRLHLVQTGGILIATAPVPRRNLMPEVGELLTEDDDSSFRAVEVTLAAHGTDVQKLVERYARSLGLDEAIASDLGLAAWLHDVGKADPRFQRWLVGGSEIRASLQEALLAKSALPPGNAAQRRLARKRAGYPDGYRHEILSLAMVGSSEGLLARAHDRDLVLHLVGSHHGWCRPLAPPVDDPEELVVQLEIDGERLESSTRHRLARLDSGVIDRFWRLNERYGWWGLAWLEAILRLADHRASEAAQAGDAS
jgi:CRISPR-associated endonuclease/helicase Cas3